MENDRSLARFAGQFVPLKIVTDGNPEWGKWARMYPIAERGIPQLYVIRADGEKLYAAVGSLSGDKLPQMMMATLRQSGRSFNDVEAKLLDQSVSSVQAALDEGDVLAAAVALSSLSKFGPVDQLGSYAKPALAAKELYEQLVSELESRAESAASNLSPSSDQDKALDQVLELCATEASFKLFPKLKAKATSLTRDLKKQDEYADLLSQAEALVKARVIKASPNPRVRSRSVAAYTSLIRRFPGTKIDEIARGELAEVNPDAKILKAESEPTPEPTPPTTDFRVWTAKSGNFSTTAKYLQQKAGKVQLQKEDGSKIVVDISQLSANDQAYLRSQQ